MSKINEKYPYRTEAAQALYLMLEGKCKELGFKCKDCEYGTMTTMNRYEHGELKYIYGCNTDKLQKDILLFLLERESEKIFI